MKVKFKKRLLWVSAATMLIVPLTVISETQVLLYKHHSLQTEDWKAMATANSALIDPNGDGNTSDSTWVSDSGTANTADHAPTVPTFTAEAFDNDSDSLWVL